MDPRRRCKYTCKVTEVSTPLPGEEQDPRWDQEENHTTVHSPNHYRGEQSPADFSFILSHYCLMLEINVSLLPDLAV